MMTFAQYSRLGLPIWASNRELIAAARAMLKPHCQRQAEFRAARHEFLRGALALHKDQQELAAKFQL